MMASHLPTHAGLLQQVLLDPGALDGAALVEVDVDVFPEAAGVVVPNSFGVAKGCEDGSKCGEKILKDV